MGNVFYFNWEIRFMVWLQSFESGFATALATFFTMLGEEYLMILILGLIYWSVDKDLGRKVALSVSGTMLCGSMIKSLFTRRRPYMDNPQIKCIRASEPEGDIMSVTRQGFSLPSLHASMSAATYGSLARETGKKALRIIAFVLPLLIGLSRNYLGVHYPTDVIAGWAIGTVTMFVFCAVADRKGYKAGFAIILLVGALGFIYCRDAEFYAGYGVTLGLMLGFLYEERYSSFSMPEGKVAFVLRPVIGVVIFALVGALLKLPVNGITSEEHIGIQMVYRLFRYTASTFVIIGPYTRLFSKIRLLK